MAYIAYTQARVFQDSTVNVTLNNMITELQKINASYNVVLTGVAAKIVQNAMVNEKIRSTIFLVESAVFDALEEIIKALDIEKIFITFQNAYHLQINSKYIEIHREDGPITVVDVQGIKCQEHSEIPVKYL